MLVFLLVALPAMAMPASGYDAAIAAANAKIDAAKAREKAITAAMQARADARAAWSLAEKNCFKVTTSPANAMSPGAAYPVAKKAMFQLVKPLVMLFGRLSATAVALKNGDLGGVVSNAAMTVISPVNAAVSEVVDLGTMATCDGNLYYGLNQEFVQF